MFGDEKTLSNVQNLLAKQQEEQNSTHISTGLDLSFKYMMQLYSDTFDTMTGATCAANSDAGADEITYSSNNNGDHDETINATLSEDEDAESVETAEEPNISFLQMPIQVHLHILAYLEASDICRLSATCQQCQSICADELLWRSVLNREKSSWTEVSNTSNPALYEDVNSDLSYKEIYMRCNPHCARQQHFDVLSIPRLLWSFLPQKAPKVAMFGPGLDSSTSTIVRKLIGNETGTFQVRGVFPAEHPGVGTGFNISMNNKAQLRLITLYSGTKRERKNANAQAMSRADRNKLLRPISSRNSGNSNSDEGDLEYEPIPAVRDLCGSTDAFIFVVDASVSQEKIYEGRPELFAMLNDRWTPSKAPVLILSCISDLNCNKVPCVDVAEQLAMHRLNRTWKMFDADVTSLSGVVEGITWLMGAVHRR